MDFAELDALIVTLRTFGERTGALRVAALLDQGEDAEAVLVDCPADGAVELSAGERTLALAQAPEAEPLALPPLEPVGPLAPADVRVGRGLSGVLAAMRALADTLPGRSVLTVELPTTDAETPLALAARRGEPLLAALGDEDLPLSP